MRHPYQGRHLHFQNGPNKTLSALWFCRADLQSGGVGHRRRGAVRDPDRRRSAEVSVRLQTTNVGNDITQIAPETTISDSESRRTNISRADGEGHYVYFLVNPQLVPFGAKDIKITTTVRRLSRDRPAGFSINYESQKGYVNTSYSGIPEDEGWHEISWKLTDASFVGQWGWNFRINAISSPNDFMIKEVRVKINP